MADKLLYTISEACAALGITRTRLYAELGDGRLIGVKSGKRTLVTRESMELYAASLPRAVVKPTGDAGGRDQ